MPLMQIQKSKGSEKGLCRIFFKTFVCPFSLWFLQSQEGKKKCVSLQIYSSFKLTHQNITLLCNNLPPYNISKTIYVDVAEREKPR